MDRRTYLTTAAAASGLAIAGCTGEGETSDDQGGELNTADGDDDSSETAGGEETDEERNEQGDENETDDGDEGSDADDETSTDEDGTSDEEDETDDDEDENQPGIVGTFDDFEDVGPWQEFLGSMHVDTERSALGTQSVVMSPNDDGTARIRRELEEPIDVRDVAPGIATTADGPGWVLIQLQDPDGNYVEYSQRIQGNTPFVRTNYGLTRVRGDPDPDRVTLIQFVRWFHGSGTQFWVDDLHFVPEPDTGKVMIHFRGGHESHHERGLPLLEEFDLTGTAFVPTERIGSGGSWLTVDELDGLASSGWTIGSYGALGRPVSGLGDDDLNREIASSRAWLDEHGYGDGPHVFAFPDAQYDEAAYELVQQEYDLAFSGQSRSQGYAGNQHLCTVAEPPSNAEEGAELVDWTAEIGGITSIPFDALDDGSLAALEAAAERLADHRSTGDLELLTPAQMASDHLFTE